MHNLLATLQNDFPKLHFVPSKRFYWSPKQNTIHYVEKKNDIAAQWSLLHELSHAHLGHQLFKSDFELLLMEVEAWEKARSLGKKYGIAIDSGHIQDCLDTYRDWLYQRSTCPVCASCSLQTDHRTYRCHNCNTVWHVSSSRLCRPYRRLSSAID